MNGTKNYKGVVYLAALVLLVPLMAYRLALAETVGMWFAAGKTEKRIELLRNESRSTGNAGDFVVSPKEQIRGGELLSEITARITDKSCAVVKYTPYITENRDGLVVQTAELVLRGDYIALVRLIDDVERNIPSCRLASIAFNAVGGRQNRDVQLNVTLIIQQITQTS